MSGENELVRFGVSVESKLLESFDRLIAAQGYAARSEALRDLMRDAIVKSKLESGSAGSDDVIGSLTLVYDHHVSDLNAKLNELQHQYHKLFISVLHVHVSHDDCLEVLVLRGGLRDVRAVSELLLSLKGVKHGKLFLTVPAKKIAEPAGGRRTKKHHQ